MKKILATILTLTMCGAMATTAFAADTVVKPDEDGNPSPSEGKTAVSFNVDPTYTITIPEKVELERKDSNGTVTYEKDLEIVAAANVRLKENQEIEVTMESDFTMNAGNTTLGYTVTVGDEQIADNDVVATFTTSTAEQKSTLHFAANDPTYAGEYSDTVTFNIATSTSTGINA